MKTMLLKFGALIFFEWAVTSYSLADPLILVTLQQPPIQYSEHEVTQGISVDIAREVFNRMGESIDIRLFPFARSLYMTKSGEADAIFTIVKNEEREQFLTYPDEIFLNQEAVMIVRKEDPVIFDGDFRKLSKYTFGVLHAATYGPAYEAAVSNGIITRFEDVNDYQQSVRMLVAKRIDVMIGPRLTLLYAVKQLGYSDQVRVLSPPIQVVPTYMAFAKSYNTSDFIHRFEDTLREVKQDGTYEKIIRKYIE